VVLAAGIYKTPGDTLRKIHRALLVRRLAGTPRRLCDAWQPHFPGR
jgi:hypothetical protein